MYALDDIKFDTISVRKHHALTTGVTTSFLERVVVYGVPKAPGAVKATPTGGEAVNLEFAYDKDAQVGQTTDHVASPRQGLPDEPRLADDVCGMA